MQHRVGTWSTFTTRDNVGSMSLIHNERVKLTAIWFNTVAAATIVTGVIAPLAALVFGVPRSAGLTLPSFVGTTLAWLLFGTILHFVARYLLGSLDE
jgi:Na+/melibiose symporter-like transporter